MYKSILTVSVLALTSLGWMQGRPRPTVPLGKCSMTLEWAPGREAVVRIDAENEEELEGIRICRPNGQLLVDLDVPAGTQRGISGLEIELRESDLDALRETYAEGSYDIRASTAAGSHAFGKANLSFDLPSAPRIAYPAPGALVQRSNLTVIWLADRSVAGYELQVEQGEDDGLKVRLPPERSSFRVPDGILMPGTKTSVEIVAIGANGNRTVSEVAFITEP